MSTTATRRTPPSPPTDEQGEPRGERVTVNLSPLSSVALTELAQPSAGMTKTDAINKALQLYAKIRETTDSGGAFYVREAGSEELERVLFF